MYGEFLDTGKKASIQNDGNEVKPVNIVIILLNKFMPTKVLYPKSGQSFFIIIIHLLTST